MEHWRPRQDTTKPLENNKVACPPCKTLPVENKAEISALSNPKRGSVLSKHIKPEHKRMSRMLGYCLFLGAAESWSGFSTTAAARLTAAERGALAFSALKSLTPDQAETTATAAINGAGAPLPPFLGGMNEARFWASCATRSELKTHAVAAFEAMNAADQAAFLRHISKRERAA